MPIIVEPDSIAATITLGSQMPVETVRDLAVIGSGAIAGLAARHYHLSLLPLRRSIESMLGKAGTNVLVRFSAFILLCIGIKIVWTGLSNLIGALHFG
jgi:multiple antibiotic resistance protein